MPEKDTLKPQVMAGIFSLVQRMEEVDGLFDKVGFTLVEEGLGGLILTELHFLALIAAEGAVNGATAARKLRMTRGGVSKMAAGCRWPVLSRRARFPATGKAGTTP